MVHFIRSLEAQCHLEIIERSWQELIDFINRKEKGDLDDLIAAHRKHLDRMVKKILMIDARSRKEVRALRYCFVDVSFLEVNHVCIYDVGGYSFQGGAS